MNWWSTFKFNCLSCILYAPFTPSDDDSFVCSNFKIFNQMQEATIKHQLDKTSWERKNFMKIQIFDWNEGFSWIRCEIIWNITFWTYVNMHRWQHYTDWTVIACCWVLYFGSINYTYMWAWVLPRLDWMINLLVQTK